jgi:REP element-mobilizing transposase RayT
MITEHPQFFTATILEWNKLLEENKFKDIIMSSLKFLVTNNRIILNGFVIMPNHIHLIWQMRSGINRSAVQRDFLKYTAQQIKFDLQRNHPEFLKKFKVNVRDRDYQIWEHRPLSVSLWSRDLLQQKLDYIHNNPIQDKWKLADTPEGYFYSSARFYYLNIDDWGFITHPS